MVSSILKIISGTNQVFITAQVFDSLCFSIENRKISVRGRTGDQQLHKEKKKKKKGETIYIPAKDSTKTSPLLPAVLKHKA